MVGTTRAQYSRPQYASKLNNSLTEVIFSVLLLFSILRIILSSHTLFITFITHVAIFPFCRIHYRLTHHSCFHILRKSALLTVKKPTRTLPSYRSSWR